MKNPQIAEIGRRYTVVEKLGAGAFGTVYKATDKVLGRTVAIKTIRLEGLVAEATGHEEMLERFYREARVSAQLRHPNIVTIHDVGESDDGTSYIAMEYIEGVGLDRLIAHEGRLPLERAAAIGAQISDALDFAHRAGVVHRDIKPANIMIEAGDRVKVTDFGIAKASRAGEQLTMTGSLLGTPSYMSPEQARGHALDGRSDLFAVGCLLYEMLAGEKAFRGESITGLILKIVMEDPPSIHESVPELPDEVVRIVNKALNKVKEERYQSGSELARDLLLVAGTGSMPTLRRKEAARIAGAEPRPIPAADPLATTAMPAPSALPVSPTIAMQATTALPPAAAFSPAPPAAAAPVSPTVAAPPPTAKSPVTLIVGAAALALVGLAAYAVLGRSQPAAVEAPPTTIPAVGTTLAAAPQPAPVTAPAAVVRTERTPATTLARDPVRTDVAPPPKPAVVPAPVTTPAPTPPPTTLASAPPTTAAPASTVPPTTAAAGPLTPAKYVDGPKMRIPNELERFRDAAITVRVRVAANGAVQQVEVLQTPDPRLASIVQETLRASRFTPASRGGAAVESWLTMKLKAR